MPGICQERSPPHPSKYTSLKLYVIAAYVFVWAIFFWRGDYVFDSESVSEVISGLSKWYQVQSPVSVGEL
jgi:hypothetical protein